MRNKILCALSALLVMFAGSVVMAGPAAAAPPAGVKTYCMQAGPASVKRSWDGKDPQSCATTYWIEKNGTKVMQLNVGEANRAKIRAKMWGAMKGDYDAAQDWCSGNSLTCTLVTSAGFAILGGILSSPAQ